MKKVTPKEVKAAREASGLSQTKAANLIGYSMRSWQEWEGGRRTMRRITLDAFQRATSQKMVVSIGRIGL